MNNAVKTIIVIYIIVFMAICLFFIPCKQFMYPGKPMFTGEREIFSIFELYQLKQVDVNSSKQWFEKNEYFYYIDWQVLFIELLPLTVLAVGTSLILKKE